MKKLFLITTTLLIFLTGTVLTASATFYTDWTYEIQYGFSAYSPESAVTASVPNGEFDNLPTTLTWGEGTWNWFVQGPSSSLVIDPYGFTGLTTLDTTTEATPYINGPTLTHNNFPVTGDSLLAATLDSKLVLHPTEHTGLDVVYNFYIDFFETPNAGTHPKDIFVIRGLDSFLFPFIVGTDPQEYVLDFDITGLQNIGANTIARDYLDGIGYTLPGDAVGFITEERRSNQFDTQFRIMGKEAHDASVVPEPASLLLMGLGLLGLAGIGRRRKDA